MELVITLKDKDLLNKLAGRKIDGVIFGGIFSNKFNYSLNDIKEISDYCLTKNIKRYISIDTFISESDLTTLSEYLHFVSGLKPDGIYINDLGIINILRNFGLEENLIYDPSTLLTNANDIGFYLSKNIDVVLARELTLEEIINIIKQYPYKLDMQVFGHLRMSYSKRKILQNYFSELDRSVDVLNKENLFLVEETRNYKLPVKETKYGTCIYTDYVLEIYQEYAYLQKLLKRAIIDTEFIDDEVIIDLVRDLNRITPENAEFLETSFRQRNNKYLFTSGYLYQKTTDKKEENE